MNGKHRKTLEQVFSKPPNGGLEWTRIEVMLKALGCDVIEGSGSAVLFCLNGENLFMHRPHPGKDALIYRVRAVCTFLEMAGVKP